MYFPFCVIIYHNCTVVFLPKISQSGWEKKKKKRNGEIPLKIYSFPSLLLSIAHVYKEDSYHGKAGREFSVPGNINTRK